jgi:L-phenylalanine/L-methionine N-acetyltransferase
MPEVEIRPYAPEDAEALWRIARQPGVMESTLAIPSLRLEQRRKRYEDMTPDDHVLVAVRHGEVAGSAGLHVGQGRKRHSATLGIGVGATHQRAGVGDALMTAILELADRWLGLRRVELGVLAGNEAAIRLYEKHGFTRVGTLRQSVAPDGELRDEIVMARLRPAMPAAATAEETAEAAPAEGESGGAGTAPTASPATPATVSPGTDEAGPAGHAGMGSSASSP